MFLKPVIQKRGSKIDLNYKASKSLTKLHFSKDRFTVVMGPVGSGKTSGCIMHLFMKMLSQKKADDGIRYTRMIVVRNTYAELKSTTIKSWQDWLKPEYFGDIVYDSPIRLHIEVSDIDCEVLFLALDKPKDVSKLLSLEATYIFFNEIREFPFSLIEAAFKRVGRYPSKEKGTPTDFGIIGDTNPPDADHWIPYFFEKKRPEGFKLIKQPPGLIKDQDGKWITNVNCDNWQNLRKFNPNYYLEMTRTGNEQDIKVYALGEYGITTDGQPVYSAYDDHIHYCDYDFDIDRNAVLRLSFDFGLHPACVVSQCINDTLHVVEEIVCHDVSIQEMMDNEIMPRLNGVYKDMPLEVFGDPSGFNRNDTDKSHACGVLAEYGLMVNEHIHMTNAIMPRLDAVKLLLLEKRIKISINCQNLRKGFLGYYKYKRVHVSGEEKYRDIPDKNDYSHIHDALQYDAYAITQSEKVKEPDWQALKPDVITDWMAM